MTDKEPTDCELLELAARAAGYTFDGQVLRNNKTDFEYDGWNPLTDDGDALRLAVILTINVLVMQSACQVEYWDNKAMKHALNIGVNEGDCGGDIFVATRRAITRAAAEIGKTL